MITKVILALDDGTFIERPVENTTSNSAEITDKNGTTLRIADDFTFSELSLPVEMGRMVASIQPRNEKTGIPAEASICLYPSNVRNTEQELISDIIDMATLREIQNDDGNLVSTRDLKLHVYGDVSDEEETEIIDITEKDITEAFSYYTSHHETD